MADDRTFSHLDEQGRARMVDVGEKPVTRRAAVAEGFVTMRPETLRRLTGEDGQLSKAGPAEALATARVAGVMAAKRTGELIPLCHPLPLDAVNLAFEPQGDRLRIVATATITARTGVEMEALTAVSVAALCVYDLCKAIDKEMQINGVRLLSKTGGTRGDYTAR